MVYSVDQLKLGSALPVAGDMFTLAGLGADWDRLNRVGGRLEQGWGQTGTGLGADWSRVGGRLEQKFPIQNPSPFSSVEKPFLPGVLYRAHTLLWVMEEMFSRFSATYSPNSTSLELENLLQT